MWYHTCCTIPCSRPLNGIVHYARPVKILDAGIQLLLLRTLLRRRLFVWVRCRTLRMVEIQQHYEVLLHYCIPHTENTLLNSRTPLLEIIVQCCRTREIEHIPEWNHLVGLFLDQGQSEVPWTLLDYFQFDVSFLTVAVDVSVDDLAIEPWLNININTVTRVTIFQYDM